MNRDSEAAREQQDVHHRPSQLFLLRVWLEETGESQGQEDWYGKLQHAVTGEAHYFHGFLELAQVLRGMISHSDAGQAGGTIDESDEEDEG